MKIFDVRNNAEKSELGEHIVGYKETGSHACYLLYGILKPGEKDRLIKPGKGHEEILLAMKGDLECKGYYNGKLLEGTAIHLVGDDECLIENNSNSEAIYIICGGHSEDSHHH